MPGSIADAQPSRSIGHVLHKSRRQLLLRLLGQLLLLLRQALLLLRHIAILSAASGALGCSGPPSPATFRLLGTLHACNAVLDSAANG